MINKSVNIDCYGRYHGDQTIQLQSGEELHFYYDKKCSNGYSLALFLNQAAISDNVFYYPRAMRVCLLTESPSNIVYRHVESLEKHFPVIFTHNEQLLKKGTPFRKLLLGTSWVNVPEGGCDLQKKHLVSFIGSIQHGDGFGYALRKQVVEFCLSHDQVDCFGKGIREIESKLIGLKQYAFSIAMENVQENYYFSEKLIDCILAESVPVYWGSPGIGEHFDLRGMLVFENLKELQYILNNLSMDKYLAMLPFVKKNKQIVLEQRWQSLPSLYERLGEALLTDSDINLLGAVQPDGWIVSSWRRLVAMTGMQRK